MTIEQWKRVLLWSTFSLHIALHDILCIPLWLPIYLAYNRLVWKKIGRRNNSILFNLFFQVYNQLVPIDSKIIVFSIYCILLTKIMSNLGVKILFSARGGPCSILLDAKKKPSIWNENIFATLSPTPSGATESLYDCLYIHIYDPIYTIRLQLF